jgi:hypothetical protein
VNLMVFILMRVGTKARMDIGPREKNILISHEHSIFVPLWAHPRGGINPVI